jgi:hypothetical protein
MVAIRFLRDPQALSSTLAALGMLQPRAFGSLKTCREVPWTQSLTIIYDVTYYYSYINCVTFSFKVMGRLDVWRQLAGTVAGHIMLKMASDMNVDSERY